MTWRRACKYREAQFAFFVWILESVRGRREDRQANRPSFPPCRRSTLLIRLRNLQQEWMFDRVPETLVGVPVSRCPTLWLSFCQECTIGRTITRTLLSCKTNTNASENKNTNKYQWQFTQHTVQFSPLCWCWFTLTASTSLEMWIYFSTTSCTENVLLVTNDISALTSHQVAATHQSILHLAPKKHPFNSAP